MAEKDVTFVHSQIVSELQARKRTLLAERDTLYRAAARITEIDAVVAELDVEISRSKTKLPPEPAVATKDEEKKDA